MANDKKKKARKVRERANLSIANHGDTVIIRNRFLVGGGILGGLMLAFSIAIFFVLRGAWDTVIFWIVYPFLFLSTLYSFLNTLFGKIVLDSPRTTMTVYSPFKVVHKFSDINYVDMKSSKKQEGFITHTVTVYIGDGRRCVNIDTLSRKQADELVSLLRGMLDNAALIYQEGNEEPFHFDDGEDEKAEGIGAKIAKTWASLVAFFKELAGKEEKKSTDEDEPMEFITKGELTQGADTKPVAYGEDEEPEVYFEPLMDKVQHNKDNTND